jgi:uncharacterized protein
MKAQRDQAMNYFLTESGSLPSMRQSHGFNPDYRVLESVVGKHLFVVDGSRLYDLDAATADALRIALDPLTYDDDAVRELQATFSPDSLRIDGTPLTPPALRSLSLNVAQGCNLACTYCYADQGAFGGNKSLMSAEVAEASVERLLADSDPGSDIVIGFMGGEPMLNPKVIHSTTLYAARRAREDGRRPRFSLTTNATRISAADAALFAEHEFSVSVSIDGPQQLNDKLRPTRSGGGSYDAMMAGIAALAAAPPGHLSARITVTPSSGRLLPILEHVLGLGFNDAGFAPVVASPNGQGQMSKEQMKGFLESMIECGQAASNALQEGRRFPFTNFETALNEIHRGSHRPYPCGAGAAYLSVSAEGDLFACHRLIDDDDFAMGSVAKGNDLKARTEHLERRHVDKQEPCKSCWARYLCGGGCYHEVDKRGRIACDYIRGWLEFCLSSYAELSQSSPQYFTDPTEYLNPTESRA